MGRPKKDNPKDKQIRIRVTKYEHMVIKEMARMYGISVTQLFREGLQKIWFEKQSGLNEEDLNMFIDRTYELADKIHQKRSKVV